MTNPTNDEKIGAEIDALRLDMPNWIVETIDLVEHAQNAERAVTKINPDIAEQAQKLIVKVAEWQARLNDWQRQPVTARLGAELRILKATLDATMDEANDAARSLHLFDEASS